LKGVDGRFRGHGDEGLRMMALGLGNFIATAKTHSNQSFLLLLFKKEALA
jgi:hypothetical protein